jgi:transposase
VGDRRIVSVIVFVIKNGLRWRDAQRDYGPHKTIYNRFVRRSRLGVFNRIFAKLGKGGKPERIMIDATHLKAHRTAASPLKKGPVPRRIGRTKGGLSSGCPLVMLLSEGQMSDYKGAALMLPALPKAKELSPTRATTRIGSAPPSQSAASPSASRRNLIGTSTSSATKSKTCSGGSKIGGASTPDTTAAPTPTCRQSVSPQPSPFGSDQWVLSLRIHTISMFRARQ